MSQVERSLVGVITILGEIFEDTFARSAMATIKNSHQGDYYQFHEKPDSVTESNEMPCSEILFIRFVNLMFQGILNTLYWIIVNTAQSYA